jgi:hypothetical protein
MPAPASNVVTLYYEFYRTPLRSIERPFLLVFRQPNSAGGVFKRMLSAPSFATEREVRKEAARMNAVVRPCETASCAGRVYPHESETREYAGTEGMCEHCFNLAFESRFGLVDVKGSRARNGARKEVAGVVK